MDLSVKIWIPENSPRQDFMTQYIVRFYCTKLKCFGEPMVATISLDQSTYDSMKDECVRSLNFESISRVSDYPEETVFYKKAYDLMV